MEILSLEPRLFRVPLPEPLEDARHPTHTHFELVTATVRTTSGLQGTGYTYTGGHGGHAIFQLLEKDLAPFVVGKDASRVEEIWEAMQWHLHYVGRGGIASFAISAADIALWDVRLQQEGRPLRQAVGGGRDWTLAYAGGIDLQFPLDKLLRQIEGYLDQGFGAVKIKVGRDDEREDIERVAAVRRLIGDEAVFMVDANMKWDPDQAVRMSRALEPYGIYWLEEPTVPDHYAAYRRIKEEGPLPVAMGENLHLVEEFGHALDIGDIDHPQPDASNIGGITGWLRVADLCRQRGRQVSTHGMQELHAHLLAGIEGGHYLEWHSFPIQEYTLAPPLIRDSKVWPTDGEGIGVRFEWDKLAPHLQAGTPPPRV
jgi:L-alanine-DL-glutamate epimerase-like enolase superfamily enzyme